MSYLTDIGAYLQANGVTGTIYYEVLDEIQDNCIAISDYQGFNEYETQDGGGPDQQNINIIVRNTDSETCWTNAEQIYRLLREHYNETIGSTFFMELTAKGPHTFLSRTPSNAFQRTINFYSKYINGA